MAKQNLLTKSKLQKAQKAVASGKLNDAVRILTQLCNRSSVNAETWLLLASVYGRMNNFNGVTECCHKALAIDANNSTAMNYLGNACTATRQYDKAITYFESSLKLEPDNPSTLNNLSTLLYSQKRFNEAINTLQKVIALKPNHLEALGNLANIFTDKGHFNDALNCYTHYVRLQPNNPEALKLLGKSYYNCGQTAKAKEVFLQALQLTDKKESIFIALADTELLENKLDAAATYLSEVLKINPSNIKASAGEANIWYRQGAFDKAHDRVKELINNGQASSNIINTYSEFCHRFDDCEYVVLEGEKLLAVDNISLHQRVSLHFNLGRVLDKNNHYNRAFEHYQKANDLMSVDYFPEPQTQFFDQIINSYDKDAIKTLPQATLESDVPIFIVGMPRSGTSLAEQILASHNHIEGAGELKDISNITESFIPKQANLHKSLLSYAKNITPEQLNNAAQTYLNKLGTFSETALRITDKMPQNFLYLSMISQMFPNAKIIHCKRNPLDTILSIYFQYFSMSHNYSFKLENIAHYYLQYQRLMAHWEETLDIPIFNLHYDDLVGNFEETCHKLVNFTGLEWDESCINFHQSERTIVTASFDQIRSPIYKSSVDRWKLYREQLQPLQTYFPDLFNP